MILSPLKLIYHPFYFFNKFCRCFFPIYLLMGLIQDMQNCSNKEIECQLTKFRINAIITKVGPFKDLSFHLPEAIHPVFKEGKLLLSNFICSTYNSAKSTLRGSNLNMIFISSRPFIIISTLLSLSNSLASSIK